MKKRLDFFGVEPQIGDEIAYNPPRYKGLVKGICVGFSPGGLPQLSKLIENSNIHYNVRLVESNSDNLFIPKTGFIINLSKRDTNNG